MWSGLRQATFHQVRGHTDQPWGKLEIHHSVIAISTQNLLDTHELLPMWCATHDENSAIIVMIQSKFKMGGSRESSYVGRFSKRPTVNPPTKCMSHRNSCKEVEWSCQSGHWWVLHRNGEHWGKRNKVCNSAMSVSEYYIILPMYGRVGPS